ncbi:MAG: GreA/GreB family elongation factor, partial [Candidatus Brocadiaceae bacterium]
LETLLAVPPILVERGYRELAESLLWYLADALRERGEVQEALRVAREGAELLPESEIVRSLLAELYPTTHPDREDLPDLVRATIGDAAVALDEAVGSLERLLKLGPGSYVLDPRRNEAGRVAEFDPDRGTLVVEFADEEKAYGPALVARLEPLDRDDFRALAAFERERLRTIAEDDPEELVCLLLSALDRRMELRRIRLYLEPILGSWGKWWQGARESLRRSAVIGMTGGKPPALFLRSKPLAHEQRLLRRFEALTEPPARLSMALHVSNELREQPGATGEVAEQVGRHLEAVVADASEENPVVALVAAAVLAIYRRQFPDLELPEPGLPDGAAAVAPTELVAFTEDAEVLTCVLDFVRRRWGERWATFFAGAMPVLPRSVCGMAADRLGSEEAGDVLREACEQILARPDAHPGAVAWLWRRCTAETPPAFCDHVDPVSVLFKLLSLAAGLMRETGLSEQQQKERIGELRSALFSRDGQPLERALQAARPRQLASVRGIAERNPALTGQMQARFASILRKVDPSLFVKEVPPWEEDVIYTTREGIARRERELERLVNERLPKVIREIGEAARFGDVSDNAEYQSAVRERARLADLSARMQEEISRARLISPNMADCDHVTVGSRVRVRNLDTGEEQSLTFLGPWDARPDEGIYGYNAPLGREFMGRKAGDTVVFRIGPEERRWEVLETGPAP